MNKNRLFFMVLGFFSINIASEEIVNQDAATIKEEINATVNAIETAAIEAFIPMKFTLSFKITPGADASTTDFNTTIATMKNLIKDGHRGSPSLYQNILIFIKELQEAIVAGMNLFTMASTSQESIATIIEEIAIEAAEETAENALTQITEEITSQTTEETTSQITEETTSKGIVNDVKNNIIITYSIVVDKIENIDLWQSIKARMIALAEALNLHKQSPAELSNMLEEIIQDAQPLQHSSITLSASTEE